MTGTRTIQWREPLFDIEGALWCDNNMQVWADDREAAQRILAVLLEHGYVLRDAAMVCRGVYKFELRDYAGRNYGRADGENYWVDLMVRTLDGCSLMYEVRYNLDENGHWLVYRTSDGHRNAWFGEHNAELAKLDCEIFHPGARVGIWPTLELR
jgi:hypothetical protein